MLGTSDTWSMSRSSHRPSEPAYYIEDCQISKNSWPQCGVRLIHACLHRPPWIILQHRPSSALFNHRSLADAYLSTKLHRDAFQKTSFISTPCIKTLSYNFSMGVSENLAQIQWSKYAYGLASSFEGLSQMILVRWGRGMVRKNGDSKVPINAFQKTSIYLKGHYSWYICLNTTTSACQRPYHCL